MCIEPPQAWCLKGHFNEDDTDKRATTVKANLQFDFQKNLWKSETLLYFIDFNGMWIVFKIRRARAALQKYIIMSNDTDPEHMLPSASYAQKLEARPKCTEVTENALSSLGLKRVYLDRHVSTVFENRNAS